MSGLRLSRRDTPSSSVSVRKEEIKSAQKVELFDKRTMKAMDDAEKSSDPVFVLAVECSTLLLRLNDWAFEDAKIDWKSLQEEYEDVLVFPTTKGESYGVDFICRALSSILGWKAFNFPKLGEDSFALAGVIRDIQDGSIN